MQWISVLTMWIKYINIFQWYCPLKSKKKCTIAPLFHFPNDKSEEKFKLLILIRSRQVMLSQVLHDVSHVHDPVAPRKLPDMLPSTLPSSAVCMFWGDPADRTNLSQLCPGLSLLSLSTSPGRGSRAPAAPATGGLANFYSRCIFKWYNLKFW